MVSSMSGRLWLAAAGLAMLLSGCFGEGSKEGGTSAQPPPTTSTPPPSTQTNAKPTISGTPPTSVIEGEPYDFRPSASDPDGDKLTFSISNKPSWASFDSTAGRLHGTPGTGTSGSYSNIVISVSDGKAQASMPAYAVTVQQVALGSATLSWVPPTQNADGSPLTDLSGYKIYYGKSSTNLNQVVNIASAGITRYVIENLSPATWYFSMTSCNSTGVESDRSTAASKTIS